jgi:alpha-tubulin suppressor-like RCC1 family protein
MPVRTRTFAAELRRLRVGLARGVTVAVLAAVGLVVAAQPAAAASATSLDASSAYVCAVVTGGRVACWGYNDDGELGDGTTVERHSPVAVDTSGVLAGKTITQISTGDGHTCALSSAGAAYCWGYNDYGQLGDGTTTERLSPVAVSGLAGVTITQISTGGNHSCALSSAGAV